MGFLSGYLSMSAEMSKDIFVSLYEWHYRIGKESLCSGMHLYDFD